MGNHVVVAACSLVTRRFPDNTMVGGVPATVLWKLKPYGSPTATAAGAEGASADTEPDSGATEVASVGPENLENAS